MATRGTIAKLNKDGSVTSIYSHWDNYPAGVGATLEEHYTHPNKIDELLALGDISSLDEDIGEQHDFDNPTAGWTLAYGRDRGETDIEAMSHTDEGEWMRDRKGSGCEYGYLWDGLTWITYKF